MSLRVLLAVNVGFLLLNSRAGIAGDSRPDIVLIMMDDMGFSDIGCYGSEIRTPHIDSLAAGGVRFTQFYNAGRCCPTRAALLTGLYPHQAGIGYMEPTNKYNGPLVGRQGLEEYSGYLLPRTATIAECLKKAGYQTAMAGKWHVGHRDGQRPTDRGFDEFFGIWGGACRFFNPKRHQIKLQDEPFWPRPDDFYTTDYFAKYAAKFVGEAKADQPFFLYLAYTAPHWPLHAWPEDIAKYRGKYRDGWDVLRESRMHRQRELGLFADDVTLSPRHEDSYDWSEADQDEMDLRMSAYAAMIDRADQGLGRVLKALEERGTRKNTLILFLSDNGGCAEPVGAEKKGVAGRRGSYVGYLLPWANASNTPFRLFKHWVHEGGIATPLIANWPERIPHGYINHDQIGHVQDLLPTILDAANAEALSRRDGVDVLPPEGQSLLPAMNSAGTSTNRRLFWEHEGNRAVRDGRWKLVSYYNEVHEEGSVVGTGPRTGAWELYDLRTDRTELNDIAAQQPELVAELSKAYTTWADRCGVEDWEKLLAIGGYDQFEKDVPK
ncbi:arylsulfatase [Stratiformator vulcanicus]|uniref:Arylsulfatase n=1 Tax=Stratiformator vulcanicus TaxID=2527980 RepID=A0A517R1V3_9PLAN|nr:arylsulfatase [Stratiformator vulcanicus]QDT37867.1 Arylsulfatase [Stratiformator vulcanicus]